MLSFVEFVLMMVSAAPTPNDPWSMGQAEGKGHQVILRRPPLNCMAIYAKGARSKLLMLSCACMSPQPGRG